MTALERAKRFVRDKAATTALVIVPLAIASPAAATPIFNLGGATATLTGSPAITNSQGFSALPNDGIRFVGDYDFTVTPPTDSSGSGFDFIQLALTGTGSGVLDVPTIAAHYDYLFTLGLHITEFSSSVTFFVNGPAGGSGTLGTGGVDDLDFTGWEPDEPLSTWSVILRATFKVDTLSTIHLNITSPRSIDIMPGAVTDAAEVPEPASILLLTTGMGFIALRRRRKLHR